MVQGAGDAADDLLLQIEQLSEDEADEMFGARVTDGKAWDDWFQTIAKLSPRKLALLAVELQSRLERAERSASQAIAIVGMSCRVPGADSPETFWNLLRQGVDAIGEVPPDRWNADEFWSADANAPGKMSTRHGGFLRDVNRFDANLFAIAPREARAKLNPQQRLLLEVSWEALEHAAVPAADSLAGSSTGVFIGISTAAIRPVAAAIYVLLVSTRGPARPLC